MRVLVYGSTYLAEVSCRYLINHTNHIVSGYVPNATEPTVPGDMSFLRRADDRCDHDIRLSIQYDQMILFQGKPAFNIHTGLLPEWGGTDILYHTLRERVAKQGLTFHEIVDRLDQGYIIATMTYPVFQNDTMVDLYKRLVALTPHFTAASLDLLEVLGLDRVTGRPMQEEVRRFRRGQVDLKDQEEYARTPRTLRELFDRE